MGDIWLDVSASLLEPAPGKQGGNGAGDRTTKRDEPESVEHRLDGSGQHFLFYDFSQQDQELAAFHFGHLAVGIDGGLRCLIDVAWTQVLQHHEDDTTREDSAQDE